MVKHEGQGISAELLREALIANASRLGSFIHTRLPQRLRSRLGVDDVLQEVWIAAFRNRHSFLEDRPDALERWLTTITQTKLLTAIKSGMNIRRGGGERFAINAGRSKSYADLFEKIVFPQKTPSSEVALGEAATAVQVALAELPAARRTALMLRYIEGQACDQIAAVMNRSKASVNSLLFNGLKQLQRVLGPASKYLSDASTSADQAER